MAIWQQLIEQAPVEIGAQAAGDDPDPGELADGLQRLQWMLESWSIEGLLVPGYKTLAHDVTESKSTYLIGPPGTAGVDIEDSGDLEEIITLNYRKAGSQEFRPLDRTNYQLLSDRRSTISTYPGRYFWDRTYPVSRIIFDALTDNGDQFQVTGRGGFADPSLDEQTNLPNGYEEAVMVNLAVRLAPAYGVKTDGTGIANTTFRLAVQLKRGLHKRNITPMIGQTDRTLFNMASGRRGASRYSGRRR